MSQYQYDTGDFHLMVEDVAGRVSKVMKGAEAESGKAHRYVLVCMCDAGDETGLALCHSNGPDFKTIATWLREAADNVERGQTVGHA